MSGSNGSTSTGTSGIQRGLPRAVDIANDDERALKNGGESCVRKSWTVGSPNNQMMRVCTDEGEATNTGVYIERTARFGPNISAISDSHLASNEHADLTRMALDSKTDIIMTYQAMCFAICPLCPSTRSHPHMDRFVL